MICIPLKIDPTRDRPWDEKLDADLRLLARFVHVYCDGNHADAPKQPVTLQLACTQEAIASDVELCDACRRLLTHAAVKRSHCPMQPKPQCKHCPNHCYHPTYRAQIRQVMKYSGIKLLMRGRVDYLLHLLL